MCRALKCTIMILVIYVVRYVALYNILQQKKTYVMPTWAATKWLQQSGQRVNHTNSEVVAPLFTTSPTNYATLYSILTLTPEISAVVVGPGEVHRI